MHHRKSPRASRIDYTASAAYFVTICTKDREHYFGEVVDGKMMLNNVGIYTTEHRDHISDHYPFVRTDTFVCMPNHIHGILIIGEHERQSIIQPWIVGTQFFASWNDEHNNSNPMRTDKNLSLHASCPSWSLGAIIRGFKIWITKYATSNNIPFHRQPRYHDHLIRNEWEFEKIVWYIQTNPQNREQDSLQ